MLIVLNVELNFVKLVVLMMKRSPRLVNIKLEIITKQQNAK